MALSFALLKDYRLDESPTLRLRSDFEVVYLDFDSEIEMSNYLRRPVMRQFCLEVLRPLRDVIMALRDRFRNASPVPRDSPWIRGQLGAYMIHIVRTAPSGGTPLALADAFLAG